MCAIISALPLKMFFAETFYYASTLFWGTWEFVECVFIVFFPLDFERFV